MAHSATVLRRLNDPSGVQLLRTSQACATHPRALLPRFSADEIDTAVQVLVDACVGGVYISICRTSGSIDRASRALTVSPDHTIEALTAGLRSAEALMFRRSIEEALRSGEVYVAYDGRDACGVAVWLSPRTDWRFHEDPSFIEALTDDVREWYSDHFTPNYEKLYTCSGVESAVARQDAWKLLWLGVVPDRRRRGIARRLIETGTAKADEERKRVIVEVTNPERVNQFQRYGFTYRSVKNLSCGRFPGFPIWYLQREPGTTPRANSMQP